MSGPPVEKTPRQSESLTPTALHARSHDLGCTIVGQGLSVPFFNRELRVSASGVLAVDGPPPSSTLSDILLDYVSRQPSAAPPVPGWITFREIPGAGPLVIAFANNTHKTLARTFGDDLMRLQDACRRLNGQMDAAVTGFDLAAKFHPLPRVPLYLRFNAADAHFPAEATLLFQNDAPNYLGLHALFAVATYLTGHLIGNA